MTTPVFGQDMVPPPETFTMSPGDVNYQSGSFVYHNNDFAIGNANDGSQMMLTRSYRSDSDNRIPPFGERTSHNWSIFLYSTLIERTGSKPSTWIYNTNVIIGESTEIFERIGGGANNAYTALNPTGSTLTYSSTTGQYTYTLKDGSFIVFEPTIIGRAPQAALASIWVKPDGTRYSFSYQANNLLSVFNNRGYGILFEYDSSNRVVMACGVNSTASNFTSNYTCSDSEIAANYGYATYSYTLNGAQSSLTMLNNVIGPSGSSAYYQYDTTGPGYMRCAKRQSSGPCLFTNTYTSIDTSYRQYDRVSAQTFPTGETYTYGYETARNRRPGDPESVPNNLESWVTDSNGAETRIRFSGFSKVVWSRDPLSRITYRNYADAWNLSQWTYPNGYKLNFSYDVRSNIIEARQIPVSTAGQSDIVSSMVYPVTCTNIIICNRPSAKTDARGSVSTFTYDPVHGGVLLEIGPAVNGIAPVKRYGYAQRYAWVKNGAASGYIKAATPIWVLTEVRTCKTTATTGGICSGGTADETVNLYDYGPDSGPNNLHLRGEVADFGTGKLNLRTCYQYDRFGNQISKTEPEAGLQACP